MSQINAPDLLGSVERTTSSGFASMSSEDFIKIMFTELTNQDPLAPTDSAALLDQMNSIRSIESDMQMVENMQSLVFENQLASASGLIGRFVGGLDWSGVRIGGIVSAVVRPVSSHVSQYPVHDTDEVVPGGQQEDQLGCLALYVGVGVGEAGQDCSLLVPGCAATSYPEYLFQSTQATVDN